MAAIRTKNTKPEIYFRILLFAQGHRHFGCQYAYMPKSRVEFWQKKFEANMNRDNVVRMELQNKGIKCLIVWECTVKKMMKDHELCETYLKVVQSFFENNNLLLEI